MELSYKKHDNEKLFDTLEKSDLGLKYIQNYIFKIILYVSLCKK